MSPGSHIVESTDNNIELRKESSIIFVCKNTVAKGFNLNGRINLIQTFLPHFCFGLAHMCSPEIELPIEISLFNVIQIENSELLEP